MNLTQQFFKICTAATYNIHRNLSLRAHTGLPVIGGAGAYSSRKGLASSWCASPAPSRSYQLGDAPYQKNQQERTSVVYLSQFSYTTLFIFMIFLCHKSLSSVLIGTRTKKVIKKPSLFAQYDLDCRERLSALAKEVTEARARRTRETPQSASMVPW